MASFLSSVLCKCPNCGKSDLFLYSSFNILHFIRMRPECPSCHANFHPEPGFYLGAMYISYVFNSVLFLTVALTMTFYFEKSLTYTFTAVGILSLFILPYTLRASRALWLLINMKFNQ